MQHKPALALLASLTGTVALAQSAPPPVIGYITVSPQPVYAQHNYTGRIAAPQIVQLQARVTGYLQSQDFKDGQTVNKGDLLYVIEQPPYQAQVEAAQATLAQAQAQARNAQLTLNRASALLHTAAGQQSSVDAAEAASLSDNAAILSAQSALQTAQINLGYTQIRAPIDGVIGATTVTPGNVVGPTSGTLATLVSEDPMWVTFALPTADAIEDRAKAADYTILVQLPDGSTYNQSGHIDFINNQITQSTDTQSWRATLPNPAHALTDGEFVTVTLRAAQPKAQIVIPLAALITDQLGDYVLKLTPDNTVARQNVTLGTQSVTTVPVLSGLSPGDRIITQGIQSIHPGEKVTPQPAEQN
jgi:membrane fusion protein (multidrug efflux system)